MKFELKQYEKAIADHNQAIEINPEYTKAYNNRGIAYTELKQYKQAMADFDLAIEIDPKYAETYFNRGRVYVRLKQYKRAIIDYDLAIEINPEYADAYNNRGTTYAELKQYEQAIADYDRVIEINSEDANAYNNRGNARVELKQDEQAIADYDRAIEINSEYAEAYNNRGTVKFGLEQYEQAIADYDRAIEINSEYAKAYNNRGNAKFRLEQYEQAIADYDRAIEINPQSAEIFFNRGTVKLALKQYDAAIEDYDKALKINPDNQPAIHNRAYALALKQSEGYQKALDATLREYQGREGEHKDSCRSLRQKIEDMLTLIFFINAIIFSLAAFVTFAPLFLCPPQECKDIIDLLTQINLQPQTVFSLLSTVFVFNFPFIWNVIIWLRSEKKFHALQEDAFTKDQMINVILSNPVENDKDRARLVEKFIDFHDKRPTVDIVLGTKTPSIPQKEIIDNFINRLRKIFNLKNTKQPDETP